MENPTQLFGHSEALIDKLRLFSLFFEDENVIRIYARTRVIHNLFRDNKELDAHKLELFHLQYTESILALLLRIKQNNEKHVTQLTGEIGVNEELIKNLSEAMQQEQSFLQARIAQANAVGVALNKLYQNLSDYARDNPFPARLAEFSNTYAKDFFYEVAPELADELLDYDPDRVYRNGYGTIEKKLMGLQCKHQFRNLFHAGLKSGYRVMEVYRLADFIVEDDDNEYFVYDPSRNLFLGCETEKLSNIETTGTLSKKAQIVLELNEKNARLKNAIPAARIAIPGEVASLLKDYSTRIEDINFLDLIDDFDIQANILKTMLNTDSI
ncbi:MAG: hypothetical protein ABW019_15630 [Chitinophagaceae bacterium]